MRLNNPTFCRIMAHEMIEKKRSNNNTPRATKPVLARMLPRSIKRTAARTKITLTPQFRRNFSDFSTVAHALQGSNETRQKTVVVLRALHCPQSATAKSAGLHIFVESLRVHTRKALLPPVLDCNLDHG